MRRIAATVIAATILVTASYAASGLGQNPEGAAPAGDAGLASPSGSPQLAELNRLIAGFELRVAANTDALDYRTLGGFYLKRAALTGNIGDYVQATEILDGALALAPGHPQTMRLLASSALAVHDFGRALWLADSLLDSDPNDADSLLIASDANLELGRTDVALTTINKLTLLAPDHPAPYIRQAEIAHLSGDQAGAIALAELAYGNARSLGFEGRNLAFYPLFQADLVLDIGEYDHAGGLVQEALTFAPE